MGTGMLSRFFRTKAARPASRTPAGCVIWAVGDVHGRSDLADRLLQAIRADLHATTAARKVVVMLGDYVDRGLDSKGVIDQLCNLAADPALDVDLIRCNHEDRMVALMTDTSLGPSW